MMSAGMVLQLTDASGVAQELPGWGKRGRPPMLSMDTIRTRPIPQGGSVKCVSSRMKKTCSHPATMQDAWEAESQASTPRHAGIIPILTLARSPVAHPPPVEVDETRLGHAAYIRRYGERASPRVFICGTIVQGGRMIVVCEGDRQTQSSVGDFIRNARTVAAPIISHESLHYHGFQPGLCTPQPSPKNQPGPPRSYRFAQQCQMADTRGGTITLNFRRSSDEFSAPLVI
mmetsp:Transcript_57941/g.142137  ORF Transcript_57941/g.142137 Transcript_57941/m.142137 type:complete len:230 (-) Transcript_57941:183-872(-)